MDIPAAVRLRGLLDVAGLEAALAGLVDRHEALRTTFSATADRPFQRIDRPGGFALAVAEVADFEEALRLADEEAGRPFDLETGPLFRAFCCGSEPRITSSC